MALGERDGGRLLDLPVQTGLAQDPLGQCRRILASMRCSSSAVRTSAGGITLPLGAVSSGSCAR